MRGRIYFLGLFLKTVASPIIGPDFKVHWFTEQLVSFKQPFQDFCYTISYYFFDKSTSFDTAITVGTFIGVGLYVMRIIQGIREGIGFGKYFCEPRFYGAIKCSFNICTILTSYNYRLSQSN